MEMAPPAAQGGREPFGNRRGTSAPTSNFQPPTSKLPLGDEGGRQKWNGNKICFKSNQVERAIGGIGRPESRAPEGAASLWPDAAGSRLSDGRPAAAAGFSWPTILKTSRPLRLGPARRAGLIGAAATAILGPIMSNSRLELAAPNPCSRANWRLITGHYDHIEWNKSMLINRLARHEPPRLPEVRSARRRPSWLISLSSVSPTNGS